MSRLPQNGSLNSLKVRKRYDPEDIDMSDNDVIKTHPARRAGQILQGLFLGVWLPIAIIELIKLAGDFALFKYQGF